MRIEHVSGLTFCNADLHIDAFRNNVIMKNCWRGFPISVMNGEKTQELTFPPCITSVCDVFQSDLHLRQNDYITKVNPLEKKVYKGWI